jgi:hypothetical protein
MTDPNALTADNHLEPHDVARYVARTLSMADRRRIEGHLADCEPCTEEVVAVTRLAGSQRSPRRWLPAAAAAAAAIVAVTLLVPGRPGPAAPADTLRAGGSDAGIAIVSPPEGGVLGAEPALEWRSVPRAASYRWTVTTADGDSLASGYTTDTVALLPANVLEAPGGTRHWFVDALLSDGSSVSSGIHEFRTGP